jgi:hypothetical protein
MSQSLAPLDPSDPDYEAIQLAVMETERGRWFLSEYARRNRQADTEMLVAALAKIERAVGHQPEPSSLEKFRLDVLEMSRAIARTRAEIAAIKPPETDGRIMEASGELESIVSATETATSEILAAAERVQEVAWTLREAGGDAEACDNIDHHAVAIYTACSFQDLTAQRTRKVTEILSFLEKRVNAMADIWQFAEDESAEESVGDTAQAAPPPAAMSQDDVDFVLIEKELQAADFEIEMTYPGPLAAEAAPLTTLEDFDLDLASPQLSADTAEMADVVAMAMADGRIDDILFDAPAPAAPQLPIEGKPQLHVVAGAAEAAAGFAKARGGEALSADEAAAAMDALKAMSVEERTKLFS